MHVFGVQVLVVNGSAYTVFVELNPISAQKMKEYSLEKGGGGALWGHVLFCDCVDIASLFTPFAHDKDGASTKIKVLVDRLDLQRGQPELAPRYMKNVVPLFYVYRLNLLVWELLTGTREEDDASFMEFFQCYLRVETGRKRNSVEM